MELAHHAFLTGIREAQTFEPVPKTLISERKVVQVGIEGFTM